MDAIFAKAKKISDSVVKEKTFDEEDELSSWRKPIGGPLLNAPRTPLLNAPRTPLEKSSLQSAPRTPLWETSPDADAVALLKRPVSPPFAPVRKPTLPTPKSVGRSNVVARQKLAQTAKMPAVPAAEAPCERVADDDSPSTEYEPFEPKAKEVDEADVAEAEDDSITSDDAADTEEDKPFTPKRHRQAAYPSAPWHTSAAGASSFHRTAAAASSSSTMWHEVAANPTLQASQEFSCSRQNRAGMARPRGGKKREHEAAMHGSFVPPRVHSTKPGGILVLPPKRD